MAMVFSPDLVLPKKFDIRRGFHNLDALDPFSKSGEFWHLRLDLEKVKHRISKVHGIREQKNILNCLPLAIKYPTSIFGGIREDGYCGGFCYCGLPPIAYDKNGNEISPFKDEVFAVFTNDERVIFEWRWERVSPANNRCPENFNDRFAEILK